MRQRLYGQCIALDTQTSDDAHSHWGHIRVMAKSLTRIHIADVGFDHRQTRAFDGVMQGHRGMGERTGIKNSANRIALLAQLTIGVNMVYQFTFMVALHKVHC